MTGTRRRPSRRGGPWRAARGQPLAAPKPLAPETPLEGSRLRAVAGVAACARSACEDDGPVARRAFAANPRKQ